jgi:hypothetical protein
MPPGLTVHTARRQRSQGLLARTARPPAPSVQRSGAVGEDASRGACVGMGMSWAWEVWRVA